MVQQAEIGSWRGVSLQVAAWDGAGAAVDLSCACMFTGELGGAVPKGGLAHLDAARGGALIALRREGRFEAQAMETLLINRPPAGIAGRAVLVIGLGDPAAWSPEVTARAAATAVRTALQLDAQSAAFAPSVLDGGFEPAATPDMGPRMVRAVAGALDTQARLVELSLGTAPPLRTWYFDVGAARFDGAVESFRAAMAALPPRSS